MNGKRYSRQRELIYEALRQLDYPGLSGVEVIKGEDWLTT